jgi:hypothetical protein
VTDYLESLGVSPNRVRTVSLGKEGQTASEREPMKNRWTVYSSQSPTPSSDGVCDLGVR